MEQLTLEQAAHSHYAVGYAAGIGSYARSKYENKKESFKAGAEWQKEQSAIPALLLACEEVLKCLANAPERNYERTILLTAIENANK